MNRLLHYWLLLLAPLLSTAARAQPLPRLIPYRQGALWGYADRQHRVRIAPAYDNVTFFHRGRARVLLDGKWAYLDSTGRLLTPPAYDWLGHYHDGRAPFERAGRQGYLNEQGREVQLLDSALSYSNPYHQREPLRWYRKNGRAVRYQALPLHEVLPDSAEPYSSISDFYQNWAMLVRSVRGPNRPIRYYYLNRQGRFLADSGFAELRRHVGGLVLADGHTLLDTTGRLIYHQPGVFILPNVQGPGEFWGNQRPELPPPLWRTSNRRPDPARSYPLPHTYYGLLDGRGQTVLPLAFRKIEALRRPVGAASYPLHPATLFLVTDSTGQQFIYDYQRGTRTSRYASLRPAYVRPLGDFLFEARRDKQVLLIDRRDRVIIPPGFTNLTLSEVSSTSAQTILPDNQHGFVLVRQDKLVGLYNYRGRRLAKPRYLGAQLISDGVADMIVRPNVGHFFSPRGRLRNKAALRAHRRHKLQVECQRYPGNLCYRMADTLYHVLPDSLRHQQIRRTVLQGRYLHITYNEVRNGKPTGYGRQGLIDTTGRVVVPFGFLSLEQLWPGYYLIKTYNAPNRLLTPRGAVVIAVPDTFPHRDPLEISRVDGFLTMRVSGQPRSLVYDSTGRLLDAQPRRLESLSDRPAGTPPRYAGTLGHTFILFDERGRPLTDSTKGYAGSGFDRQAQAAGLLWVQRRGKWGFIDASGQTSIPFQYEAARSFHEGLAAVSVAGRWGFIDKTGRLVIAAQYDSVSDFGNGLAVTIRRKLYTATYEYIDRQGRPAFTDQLLVRYTLPNVSYRGDPPYESDAPTPRLPDGRRLYNEIQPFYRGRAKVRRHFGTGYIDVQGREVIPTRYSYPTTNFTDEVAWGSYHYWTYVLDSTGHRLDSLRNADPSDFVNGLSAMTKQTQLPPTLRPRLDFGDPQQPLTGYLYWRPGPNGQRQLFGLRADVLDPVRLIYPHRRSAVPVDAGLGRPAVRLVVAQPQESPEQPCYSTRIHSLPDGRVLHYYPGQQVAPFHQGLARAFYTYPPEPEGSRQVSQYAVGLIRPDGQVVIPYQYQQAGDLSEGLIPVQLPAEAGYLDLNGQPFFE